MDRILFGEDRVKRLIVFAEKIGWIERRWKEVRWKGVEESRGRLLVERGGRSWRTIEVKV